MLRILLESEDVDGWASFIPIYNEEFATVYTTYVIESVWSDINNKKKNDIETTTLFKYTLYEQLYYSYYNIVYSTRTNERCGFVGIDYRVVQQKHIAYNFVGI